VAHPTDSSTLFPCAFCHNSTLQHNRLLSVMREKCSEPRRVVFPKMYRLRRQAMYAYIPKIRAGFLEGVYAAGHRPPFSCDPPPRQVKGRSPTEEAPARQGCKVLGHKLIDVVVVAVVDAVDTV
jgi:hypothetical protein